MIRPIQPADMDAVTRVRTAVSENHMSVAEMAGRGITPAIVLAELASGELGGWLVEEGGEVVAFSMARHSDGSIFALFTAPGHEGKGHGSALLAAALAWLRETRPRRNLAVDRTRHRSPSVSIASGDGVEIEGSDLRKM